MAASELRPGSMLCLPPGRHEVRLAAAAGTVILLLGGIPLGERLLLWRKTADRQKLVPEIGG